MIATDRPTWTGRRHSVVYGFRTLQHPGSGNVELGYIGQTVQKVGQRERQHRDAQPWSDLIVGEAFVVAAGLWTQAELDEEEARYIRTLRPRYNYDHNLDNPQRIPIPEARKQRWERDRAVGCELWQPGERADGGAQPASRRRVRIARRLPHIRWTRRRVRAAVLTALWLVMFTGATVWMHIHGLSAGHPLAWRPAAEWGAGLPTCMYALAAARSPRRRRRRRRAW